MYEKYNLVRHPKALFSPSALNAYLDCRLKFYYRYVAGLKAPDEVSAEIRLCTVRYYLPPFSRIGI